MVVALYGYVAIPNGCVADSQWYKVWRYGYKATVVQRYSTFPDSFRTLYFVTHIAFHKCLDIKWYTVRVSKKTDAFHIQISRLV